MGGKTAIYLSGGGARGAYQAGVIQALKELVPSETLPATLLSSVSVGSINAAYLAQHADDFAQAASGLAKLWLGLKPHDIYQTNAIALLRSVFRNLRSFVFHVEGNGFLLDGKPLKAFLDKHVDLARIHKNVDSGLCELDVATINYEEKATVSYYQSNITYPQWYRQRQRSEKTDITVNHLMASSALPLFFEPVKLNGAHHGDGGLRLANPLRSAIKMQANKIFVIGTRMSTGKREGATNYARGISFASLLGQMLNALFLDNLDRDIQQIGHINEAVRYLGEREQQKLLWRPVEVLAIKPSRDIGKMATQKKQLLPGLLRYLFSSFGEPAQSGDILSFLLFDGEFAQQLIELGYDDTMKKRAQIEQFFTETA